MFKSTQTGDSNLRDGRFMFSKTLKWRRYGELSTYLLPNYPTTGEMVMKTIQAGCSGMDYINGFYMIKSVMISYVYKTWFIS